MHTRIFFLIVCTSVPRKLFSYSQIKYWLALHLIFFVHNTKIDIFVKKYIFRVFRHSDVCKIL